MVTKLDDEHVSDVTLAFPSAICSGMSLRQWYAGMAMQGLVAKPDEGEIPWAEVSDDRGRFAGWAFLSERAFAVADAMIAEGEKHAGGRS